MSTRTAIYRCECGDVVRRTHECPLPDPSRDIHDLIERSSFGTPAAKAARESVSDVTAARVVGMADGIAAEQRRILALLDDPGVIEACANSAERVYGGAPGEVTALDRHAMRAALAVLRERIGGDR